MPFNETIKQKVRRKSGYACCVCHSSAISVEVHHIVPEEEGGPNVHDNAAPLCPSCHSDFGGNAEKRTRIREMRGWWYETVERMYKPRDFTLLGAISNNLDDLKNNLPEIKKDLTEFVNLKISEITPQNAQLAVSSIATSVVAGLVIPHQGNSSDIFKKIIELEDQNKSLKAKLDIKDKFKYRNSAYWIDGDSEPYCSRCLEVDGKPIHLHPDGNPAYYFCPNCKANSIKIKPELDRSGYDSGDYI